MRCCYVCRDPCCSEAPEIAARLAWLSTTNRSLHSCTKNYIAWSQLTAWQNHITFFIINSFSCFWIVDPSSIISWFYFWHRSTHVVMNKHTRKWKYLRNLLESLENIPPLLLLPCSLRFGMHTLMHLVPQRFYFSGLIVALVCIYAEYKIWFMCDILAVCT